MPESIKFSFDLPVSPERAYRAWLDGHEHSQFSGSPARIEARAGGKLSLQGGAITGETLSLTPFSRIVHALRDNDFADADPESRAELTLEPTCLGALLTLEHTGIPDGQSRRWMQFWEERAFRPMLAYFDEMVAGMDADIDG